MKSKIPPIFQHCRRQFHTCQLVNPNKSKMEVPAHDGIHQQILETYDSMLMWGHYAMNHTGYCIEYEFEKDDICYSNLHPVEYTKDRYTISKNDIIDGKSDMVYKITCRKAEAWSYEKEWRIVTENYSRTRSLEVDPKTRYVLDLKENIKAFYLGAKINEKEKSEIIQFAKKNNRIVYQMILSANTYELRAERIDNV